MRNRLPRACAAERTAVREVPGRQLGLCDLVLSPPEGRVAEGVVSHGVWDVSPRSRQQRSVTWGAGAARPSAGPAGGGLTLADRPPAERRGKPSIRLPCNLMGREITAQRLGTAHVEATHSPSREGCRERLRSYSGNA